MIWIATTVILAVLMPFVFMAGVSFEMHTDEPKKGKGPNIPLNSVCPACGNAGCKLFYSPETKKVRRCCNTCSCVVEQDPVAPRLFADGKS